MENSVEGPRKIQNGPDTRPSDSTSGYMCKGNENRILKRYVGRGKGRFTVVCVANNTIINK